MQTAVHVFGTWLWPAHLWVGGLPHRCGGQPQFRTSETSRRWDLLGVGRDAAVFQTAFRKADVNAESGWRETDGCCGQKPEGSLGSQPVRLETRGRGMLLRKNDDSTPLTARHANFRSVWGRQGKCWTCVLAAVRDLGFLGKFP